MPADFAVQAILGYLLGPALVGVAVTWACLGTAALWRLVPRAVTFAGALLVRLVLVSWLAVVAGGMLCFLFR